jgi:hypothetical protein
MAACIMSSDLDDIADPLHSASGVVSSSTSDLGLVGSGTKHWGCSLASCVPRIS